MRDLLTALAGAVILVLVAALAVPPFVDWPAHRALVDRAVSRSLGLPARSEGRIEVRFLPSPRLRLDRLHVGGEAGSETGRNAARPTLDARFVKAEVALAPLLKGEFRFTETRVGRAEVKLPVTEGEALVLPPGLTEGLAGRDFAIEDLHVQQFLLTTVVPATGRTDQLYAQALRVEAPALAGPWRVEGTSGGLPFRLATGEVGSDGRVAVKLSGGGDAHPRFEADARLGLVPAGEPGARTVEGEGSARLVVGPPSQAAGAYLPFTLAGKFKVRGSAVRFETASVEIDPGGQALRLAGSGRLDLRQWRAGLSLGARRLDLDAFFGSTAGQALAARGLAGVGTGLPVMLDLDLAVESAVLGFDEWSDLALAATLDRAGGLLLRRLSGLAPGEAALLASGQIETDPRARFSGSVSLKAPASDGLGRYLRRLGLDGPAVALLDGRPVEASAEVSAADPVVSVRNLRLALGPGLVTGNVRYDAGEAGARGRLDAQIRARDLDVAALPPLGEALPALRDHDFGLTLEARDLRYGSAGSGTGTIAARIQSDGPSLVVDSLEVVDLAGASAHLSGRIDPDGAGRIGGRVSAPQAAPLLGLLDRVFGLEARRLPVFLRTAPLDLAVTLARDAGSAAGEGALRTTAKGTAGGGTLDLALATRSGRIERAEASLAAPRAGPWFGRSDIPGLQQPADLRVEAVRGPATDLDLRVAGTVAGLRVATPEPLRLGSADEPPAGGTLRLETADLGPFLTLAGGAELAPGPWPAQLSLDLGRDGASARAILAGSVAGAALEARLARSPDGALSGDARLARLSLPQLAAALVVPAAGPRFGPAPAALPPIALDLAVGTLDLGRGLAASGASLHLGLEDGALGLRDLAGRLAEGRLDASLVLTRRGGTAAVSGEGTLTDAAIPVLAGGSPLGGRFSASLRFSATGDSAPALAANLAGSGEIALSGLTVPEADPEALGRALARALDAEDPLREGRLRALVAEELAKGAAGLRGRAAAPATIVGGQLRAGPFDLDLGPAHWTGGIGYDLRSGRLDARGTLTGGSAPKGWSAGAPAVQFALTGPLAAPEPGLDVGALTNGLSAVVLQRELERIELFEADQVERQRRRARVEMDRARAAALKALADKAAAEKVAAEKAAAEEAARQARQRAQQAAAEEARRAREAEGAGRPPGPPTDEPLDIRPQGARP